MKATLKTLLWGCSLACLLTACEAHLITDEAVLAGVEKDLSERQQDVKGADFSIIYATDDAYEHEALSYLYAYMPMSDLAGHPGGEHLMNIRATRRATKEMKWGGKKLPERLVRQYILPARVHTEALDSARVLLYEPLKTLVNDLPMRQAALKVREWVERQVAPEQLADRVRVASPMTTLRNASGSETDRAVLLVAALRAVSIPARLVYTSVESRDAHGHAWAEAWCEGEWLPLPLGATAVAASDLPGKGSGLVLTHAFGPYEPGEEGEVLHTALSRTLLNVTEHYLPTAPLTVKVTDDLGAAVPGACIDLLSIGRGDDHLVATLTTDSLGELRLSTASGQLLAWAYSRGRFGYEQVTTGKAQEVVLTLNKRAGDRITANYNAAVTDADTALTRPHDEATTQPIPATSFMSADDARSFAKLYRLPEVEQAVDFITRSRANHPAITGLMARLRSEKSKKGGFDLLSRLSEEDLRSITLPNLLDHMQSTVKTSKAELFYQYVRQPRIDDEGLSSYKVLFTDLFTKEEAATFLAHPADLATWVAEHIRVDDGCNAGSTPITPLGVWQARVADSHSRDIFFVAVARSVGLPARIDRVTGRVQLLMDDDRIADVHLDAGLENVGRLTPTRIGWLSLSAPASQAGRLAYGRNFTLYRVSSEGRLLRLGFGETDVLQPFTDWHGLLQGGASLPAGSNYILLTALPASHASDAPDSMQVSLRSLTITPNKTTRLNIAGK